MTGVTWRCDCGFYSYVHREHCDRCGARRSETAAEVRRIAVAQAAAKAATKRRILSDPDLAPEGKTM